MDGLVFQGGTSLRLCYGSNRYSEDLDFVGGSEYSSSALAALNVDRWQVSITTDPGRRNLPKQRIKIDVANIPAYTKTVRAHWRNKVCRGCSILKAHRHKLMPFIEACYIGDIPSGLFMRTLAVKNGDTEFRSLEV